MPHANTFEGRGCEGKGHDFYPPAFFIEGRGFLFYEKVDTTYKSQFDKKSRMFCFNPLFILYSSFFILN
jgi:hypothetical protein